MDHGSRWLRLFPRVRQSTWRTGRECRQHQQLVQVPLPPPPLSFGAPPPPPAERIPPPPPLAPASATPAVAVPPPPPGSALPSPQMIVRPDLSQFDSTSEVQQILQEIKSEGPRAAISSNWERIKELHEKEAFSIQEIVWLFDRCRSVTALRTASLNARVLGNPDEASVPLGTLIVQLFTNFVCHQIPSLEPSEITCFIEALTSPALPMDEFWLFMMAKQIQDASDRFSPSQIVTIARCYAWKNLEDEEFFDALCSSVHRRLAEFTLPQLAQFLFSCARVRFLHQAGHGTDHVAVAAQLPAAPLNWLISRSFAPMPFRCSRSALIIHLSAFKESYRWFLEWQDFIILSPYC